MPTAEPLQSPLPLWEFDQMADQDRAAYINKIQAATRRWLVNNRPDLVAKFDEITTSPKTIDPKHPNDADPQWVAEMAGHLVTAQPDPSQANSAIQDWAVVTDKNLLSGPNLRGLTNQNIGNLSNYLAQETNIFKNTCPLEPELTLDKSTGKLTAPASCAYQDLSLNEK